MRHTVKDIIEPYAESHGSKSFGVVWVVGPFPCVAKMHVVADGDDDSPLVVANGAPLRLVSIFLVSASGPNILLAGYLHLVVDIVECVEDLIAALQVLDGT